MLRYLAFDYLCESSSSDEELGYGLDRINPRAKVLLDYSSDDDDEDLQFEYTKVVIDNCVHLAQRIHRVKITNYLEIIRKYEDDAFIMHFRLSRSVAYDLVDRFQASNIYHVLNKDPFGKQPVTPECHILSFLWFCGHESAGYRDVADRFNVTISTLFEIISRVIQFIYSIAPQIIKLPDDNNSKIMVEEGFRKKAGFPRVMGAVDGTHIRIDRPHIDGNSYFNRKKYYSIQVQGVVDHRSKFTDVYIGYPGSVHDARVFRESGLSYKLNALCDGGRYILGDSAYPCRPNLLVPYKDNGHLNQAKKLFNQKLSATRISVEHAFGLLKQRFRMLYHLKLKNPLRMIEFIYCCCVLHNLASDDDVILFDPAPICNEPNFNDDGNEEDEVHGVLLRDQLCQLLNQ